MGNFDWSQDQLERDWSESFALIHRMEREGVLPRGESSALADGVLRCMNGALLKVSEVLEAQAGLRRELALLREEQARAQGLRQEQDASREARILALEREVQSLRTALARTEAHAGAQPGPPLSRAVAYPPVNFLNQPMVIRSGQEKYLGVCDKNGQALRMGDFLCLVERADPARLVCTSWEAAGECWILSIGLTCQGQPPRSYTLEASTVRTPSGNLVTLLRRMSVGGEGVPHAYILQMFRQLRDGMQE